MERGSRETQDEEKMGVCKDGGSSSADAHDRTHLSRKQGNPACSVGGGDSHRLGIRGQMCLARRS